MWKLSPQTVELKKKAGKNERTVGVQEKSVYGSWWNQGAESSKKIH